MQKILFGPKDKGLQNNVEAFAIDNEAFPVLLNAYQWRKRVKRKRGTEYLNRCRRVIDESSISNTSASPWSFNIYTELGVTKETNAQIEPGSVSITISTPIVFEDNGEGLLTSVTVGNSGTIDYTTGDVELEHTAGVGISTIAQFNYFPLLPAMGFEDDTISSQLVTFSVAFDTKYGYAVSNSVPYPFTDINLYKNPVNGTYQNYISKSEKTSYLWNGEDYQQFYSENYEGAMWVTNGITIPFSTSNIGMQYKPIIGITTDNATSPGRLSINITAHGLVVGDFVFINEVAGYEDGTPTYSTVNFQTGYVTTVTDANNVIVTFPNADFTSASSYISGGIAQYLTSNSSETTDCIKWYDGNPRTGNQGWVNFCPPLSQFAFGVGDLPSQQYYLVGARAIANWKDRILFFGPVVQTSAAASQVYLQDTIIFSQNGTPYYTCSFTGDPSLPTTEFNEILVPTNRTATASAWYEDQAGFGGYLQAGKAEKLNTIDVNEDDILTGFDSSYSRVVYTSNDILPFRFIEINSEFGSSSTFGNVDMGSSVLSRGDRGYLNATQTRVERLDRLIPDEIFQMRYSGNGRERVTAQRDYINEWVQISYPSQRSTKFNDETLFFNYVDQTWAKFLESYTTYGQFQKQTGYSWETLPYKSWAEWTDSWSSGEANLLVPEMVAGNQQGYFLFTSEGTNESVSLQITDISTSTITSPNHSIQEGEYIQITDCLGSVSEHVNGKVFQVSNTTDDTFDILPAIPTSTYNGNGQITRVYRPFMQTKQFPVFWEDGRKTRVGVQKYLFTTTDRGEIQLLIYLSTDSDNPYNDTPIIPLPSDNSSLIYSDILYTCPESTNLGLTPSNSNLLQLNARDQKTTWHRMNTSLIGDTIQVGFTLSDSQMKSYTESNEALIITGATQNSRCVLTVDNNLDVGSLVKITGVVGMTDLNVSPGIDNSGIWMIVERTDTTLTIEKDTTASNAYVSGGILYQVSTTIQVSEIELHTFNLELHPSRQLA